MTREEAITNHRKMWRWMADESRRAGSIKTKEDYLKEYEECDIINDCYLCDFTSLNCNMCPIIWSNNRGNAAYCIHSYFKVYRNFIVTYEEFSEMFTPLERCWIDWYADLCEKIAGLPERGEHEYD